MAEIPTEGGVPVFQAPGQDSLLLDRLRRLEGVAAGTLAVHFHLSRLKPYNRQPHHIRIAERSFDGLTASGAAEIQLFTLANCDLVVLARNVKASDIERAVSKMRALFKGDSLLNVGQDGEDQFVTWYDLGRELDLARETVRRLGGAETAEDPGWGRNRPELPGRLMTPEALDDICLAVGRVGFADLIRQQSAISIGTGGQGELLFREHYVAIRDLQKRVAPEVDLLSDRWLFQHLTELLDQRVLATFARHDFAAPAAAISLNLNLATLMSPQFRAFDRQVGEHTDKVVIEIQKIDIFADIGAYDYMRDTLQGRGYRVLIDGLNPLSLQFFDPGLLKADLFKVSWGEEFVERVPTERAAEMRALIQAMGRDKVLVSRVDSEEAVKFGLGLGVTRFQGRFVDRLLSAMAARIRRSDGDAAGGA